MQVFSNNPWVSGSFNAGILFLVFVILFLFGRKTFLRVLTKIVGVFRSPPDEALVQALYKFLRRVLFFIALYLSVEGLPLPHQVEIALGNTIFVAIAFLIVMGLFDLSDVAGQLLRYKAKEFEPLITKLLKMLSVVFALMIVMRHFNYDIWHIVTALGVGTLAVGLAAQPTLSNMIAGFTILIDRPFRPGERVALVGGEIGDVVLIGMRSTRIQTTDGNMLIVSNSEMVNSKVINYSLPTSHYGHKIKFYFPLEIDVSQIKPVVQDCVGRVPEVVKESVKVLATNMMENSIEISAVFNIEHFSQTGVVTDRVIDTMIVEMRKRNYRFATTPLPKA